jgi:hypothetical protein
MISTYMEPAEVNNAYFFGLQVNLRRSSLDIERWELRMAINCEPACRFCQAVCLIFDDGSGMALKSLLAGACWYL